jgi:branched-chain amino acid transport system substrate-binding protein
MCGFSRITLRPFVNSMVCLKGLRVRVFLFCLTWFVSAVFAQTPAPAAPPIQLAMIEGLSGPFANTGDAVYRNLAWAVERVNARGGIKTKLGMQKLVLKPYDSKGQNEEAITALKSAIDDGARIVLQGNSSANALALIDAINKHNEREPDKRVVFLNYSAVDPALTNERCSFWHFRFDASSDMRMAALVEVLKQDRALKSVYLIGQDYSFGQSVLREAKRQLALQRPDVQVVGDELHPIGRVKDFTPYAVKIKSSGAEAVITGNWGNDLTLLVKAAKDVGYTGKFYTFYGNALGAPAAIGEAGVGKLIAVADWLPNYSNPKSAGASERFMQSFRARFPKPADDYVHMRMQLMIEALAGAINSASGIDALAIARALEKSKISFAGQTGEMRASDHQFQQPLMMGVMGRKGDAGVKFDVEGSGYGFKVIRSLSSFQAALPTSCKMTRP